MLIRGLIQFLIIVCSSLGSQRWCLVFYGWQVASEIFDTLDRLDQIGERLENCLDRFKYLAVQYHVSGPLRGLTVNFYAHILQLAITAPQFHRRSEISMNYLLHIPHGYEDRAETAVLVFRKVPFNQFLERLDYLSDKIHMTDIDKSLLDIREGSDLVTL